LDRADWYLWCVGVLSARATPRVEFEIDSDLRETQVWLDALSGAITHPGNVRGAFLLRRSPGV
jgi:hypothetical protein